MLLVQKEHPVLSLPCRVWTSATFPKCVTLRPHPALNREQSICKTCPQTPQKQNTCPGCTATNPTLHRSSESGLPATCGARRPCCAACGRSQDRDRGSWSAELKQPKSVLILRVHTFSYLSSFNQRGSSIPNGVGEAFHKGARTPAIGKLYAGLQVSEFWV